MQNRLDGAAEAQAASEKQLAELHSAIAAERVARPESVSPLRSFFFFSTDHLWGSFYIHVMFIFLTVFRRSAARHWLGWLPRGERLPSCKANSRRTARVTPFG
jgi:hypothetical protein